jgi:hypothetical protein
MCYKRSDAAPLDLYLAIYQVALGRVAPGAHSPVVRNRHP